MDAPHRADTPVEKSLHQEEIHASSLVLSAVDIPHTITKDHDGYSLYVSEENRGNASYHLARYREENRDWPPPKMVLDEADSSVQPLTLLVVGALILFFSVTGPWSPASTWFANGAGDADAILQKGEYYRLITALTLHADLTHLLGNCLFGGFLLHFFSRTAGYGLGLFAALTAAVLGNGVNVFLHGGDHRFVGFSTAVFATIGMQAMIGYHITRKLTGLRVVAPFMAGAALLAMTGSSGARTDLGAHLFGLFCGFAVGRVLITDLFLQLRHWGFLQTVLFLLSWFTVYFSWSMAMDRVY